MRTIQEKQYLHIQDKTITKNLKCFDQSLTMCKKLNSIPDKGYHFNVKHRQEWNNQFVCEKSGALIVQHESLPQFHTFYFNYFSAAFQQSEFASS